MTMTGACTTPTRTRTLRYSQEVGDEAASLRACACVVVYCTRLHVRVRRQLFFFFSLSNSFSIPGFPSVKLFSFAVFGY
jgi:hypothetical protein